MAGDRMKELAKSGAQWLASKAIFLSDEASARYANHAARMGAAQAMSDALGVELKHLADLKALLQQRYFDASPEERLRIKRDIGELDEQVRLKGVYLASVMLPSSKNILPSSRNTHANAGKSESNDSWHDRFEQFARRMNEDWRADLLAKALQSEMESPNSVGMQALWQIGTMDADTFHCFAALLDLMLQLNDSKVLPFSELDFTSSVAHVYGQPACTLGTLTFQLKQSGLIVADAQSGTMVKKGDVDSVHFHDEHTSFRFTEDGLILGICLTPVGEKLSNFYDPKHPGDFWEEKVYRNFVRRNAHAIVAE